MTPPPTILTIVLDAVGIATLQRYLDTADFEVALPHLAELGLGTLLEKKYHDRIPPSNQIDIAFAASPQSTWSDSVMGHRELLGYIDPQQFELFMSGFPKEYVSELERRLNIPVLFNQRAGGSKAIELNHKEHVKTKGVVLYASMCDPLVQLAAYEEIIAPEELGRMAQVAFDLAMEQGLRITRVITRPYVITNNEFVRTQHRRDIVAPFPQGIETFIDIAQKYGVRTISIGKCADVVNSPWTKNVPLNTNLSDTLKETYPTTPTDKNPYSLVTALDTLQLCGATPNFIMCNLPDTDSVYGHNRNPQGALKSIIAFDSLLPLLYEHMPSNSFLLVTADHGMRDGGDYGYHSREDVPILGKGGFDSPLVRDLIPPQTSANSYAALGQICAKIFGFEKEYVERCKLTETLSLLE